jgi:type VI secretion system protein ImpB
LAGIRPRLAFQVDNKLQDDGTKLNVELRFGQMDDFSPSKSRKQVEPLRKLVEARERLSNLVNKMDDNDKLEGLLQQVISSTDSLKKLSGETGRGRSSSEEA